MPSTATTTVRDMTASDEAFVGTCARAERSAEIDSCANHRVRWLRENAARGVRAKVAVRDDRPVGFLYVVPIEISPWGPIGEDLLVMPCIYVAPEEKHQGAGHALVEAAEEEATRQGRKGLATMACNHEAWFMPRPFFEDLGYEVADQRGVEVVLFKALHPDAMPPKLLVPSFELEPAGHRIVVDLFWNRFCLTSDIEAQRVREVAAEFGDDVVLREHDAGDPEVLRRYQIPRAIFVDGEQITWGFEAPRDGLRDAIRMAREGR